MAQLYLLNKKAMSSDAIDWIERQQMEKIEIYKENGYPLGANNTNAPIFTSDTAATSNIISQADILAVMNGLKSYFSSAKIYCLNAMRDYATFENKDWYPIITPGAVLALESDGKQPVPTGTTVGDFEAQIESFIKEKVDKTVEKKQGGGGNSIALLLTALKKENSNAALIATNLSGEEDLNSLAQVFSIGIRGDIPTTTIAGFTEMVDS